MISASSAGARAFSQARARAIRRWLIDEMQAVAPMRHTLGRVYGNGITFQYPHGFHEVRRKADRQHFTETIGGAAVIPEWLAEAGPDVFPKIRVLRSRSIERPL
jgi:hypothetical protein